MFLSLGYVSTGSLRACSGNNPYMGHEYDRNKARSYVLYLDANNLYGKAMSSYLPTHGYEWVDNNPGTNLPMLAEIQHDPTSFIQGLSLEDSHGYLFEVDMDVPPNLHDKLNDLPPAPSRRSLDTDVLSSAYQEPLLEKLGQDSSCLRSKKLIADLHPKKTTLRIPVHYSNTFPWGLKSLEYARFCDSASHLG